MGDRRLDAVVKQPENPDNGRLTHCVFFIAEENGRLMRSVRNAIVIGFAIILGFAEAGAGEFNSILRWRNIGPYRGARTRAIAGVPSQSNVFYMAPVNLFFWRDPMMSEIRTLGVQNGVVLPKRKRETIRGQAVPYDQGEATYLDEGLATLNA